jgi:ribosome-associated toxin RatA of RatAB toxin-antitoxin module
MQITKSVLVPHPAEAMFDLIEAVEHYPAFVPAAARWRCSSAPRTWSPPA